MRDFVSTSLFLLALGLLEAALGPRAPRLRTALAFLALAPLGLEAARAAWRRDGPPRRGNASRVLALVAAALAFGIAWMQSGPAQLFALAAGFAWLAAAAPAGDRRAASTPTLALAAFFYAGFATLRDHLTLWPLLTAASASVSQALAGLAGGSARLGPTYAGAWLLAGCIALFGARLALTRRARFAPIVLAVALLSLVPLAWLALGRLVPGHVHGTSLRVALGWRIGLFALCLVPLAVFMRAHPPSIPHPPPGAAAWRRVPRRAGIGAALAVAGCVLLAWSTPIPSRPLRLLIDTRGAFNMQPLRWGKYGPQAPQGASLATLPALVEAYGFECTLHDTTLDAALLARHDVLLVMNPTQPYPDAEHEAIWSFVRRGGGLLVLGDHTNIQETMQPLAHLLRPVGVRVEFDSAIPLAERWSWYNCMRFHPHPVTRGLSDESDVRVSVGASLHLPLGALPLLGGRDAFSDPGDWKNTEGAYLGNMRHDRGELLGDLHLAAACDYGRGRVVVFGDTSPFQRSAVAHTHDFVVRVLGYLAGGRRGVAPPPVRLAGGALLAGGAALLAGAPLVAGAGSLAVLGAAAAIPAAHQAWMARVATVHPPSGPLRGDIAWIDRAHGNRIDVHAGREDGIGGLVDHLWRQEYVPLAFRTMDLAALPAARLFVTVAPAFPFTAAERAALRRFVEQGGLLVVATGYEERRGAASLLADFGYAIGRTPLGAAHRAVTHLEGQTAMLHESWPVLRPEGRGEVWVDAWDYPLVVFERIGRGGLLVIGDSRFLCDVKLESAEEYVETNIDFLRQALATAQPRAGKAGE